MYYNPIFNDTSVNAGNVSADTMTVDGATVLKGPVFGFKVTSDETSTFTYNPETATFFISTPPSVVDPNMLTPGLIGQVIMSDGSENVWQTIGGDVWLQGDGTMTVMPGAIDKTKIDPACSYISLSGVQIPLGSNLNLTTSYVNESPQMLYFTVPRAQSAAIAAIRVLNTTDSEIILNYNYGLISSVLAPASIVLAKINPGVYSAANTGGTLVQRDPGGAGYFSTLSCANGLASPTDFTKFSSSITLGTTGNKDGVLFLASAVSPTMSSTSGLLLQSSGSDSYMDNTSASNMFIGTKTMGSVYIGGQYTTTTINGGRGVVIGSTVANRITVTGAVTVAGTLTVNGQSITPLAPNVVITQNSSYVWLSSSTVNPVSWQVCSRFAPDPSSVGVVVITPRTTTSSIRLTCSVWCQASTDTSNSTYLSFFCLPTGGYLREVTNSTGLAVLQMQISGTIPTSKQNISFIDFPRTTTELSYYLCARNYKASSTVQVGANGMFFYMSAEEIMTTTTPVQALDSDEWTELEN